MNYILETTSTQSAQQELYFELNNETNIIKNNEWHLNNIDIVVPVLIIIIGLFQFILRKWIIPVSDDIIEKLEKQFPSQGLIYNPIFGIYIAVTGIILLITLNFYIFL